MPDDVTTASKVAQVGAKVAQSNINSGLNATAEIGRAASESASAAGSATNDYMKIFADLKLPAMPDLQGLMDAHRRNLETLSAANRVALEGAQAVGRRHMEIVQQTLQELGENVRQLASPDAPQAKAARQAELLKRSYETAVANMRELRDLIQKSNGEALELLNRRFVESLDEAKSLIDKAQTRAA